jgi:hypothetical protein
MGQISINYPLSTIHYQLLRQPISERCTIKYDTSSLRSKNPTDGFLNFGNRILGAKSVKTDAAVRKSVVKLQQQKIIRRLR